MTPPSDAKQHKKTKLWIFTALAGTAFLLYAAASWNAISVKRQAYQNLHKQVLLSRESFSDLLPAAKELHAAEVNHTLVSQASADTNYRERLLGIQSAIDSIYIHLGPEYRSIANKELDAISKELINIKTDL